MKTKAFDPTRTLARAAATLAVAVAFTACAGTAIPATAHATTYSATIYNGTATGGDWGMSGHITTATLGKSTLKLGNGSLSYSSSKDGWPKDYPKGTTFKLAKSCKFYKNYIGDVFADKISTTKAKAILKKANVAKGTGPWNGTTYNIYFTTKGSKVTKVAIYSKSPTELIYQWSTSATKKAKVKNGKLHISGKCTVYNTTTNTSKTKSMKKTFTIPKLVDRYGFQDWQYCGSTNQGKSKLKDFLHTFKAHYRIAGDPLYGSGLSVRAKSSVITGIYW